MSLTRRAFLLSTAGASAGAILPSFYFRALEFFEQFEEPLLVAPAQSRHRLCVFHNMDDIELCWGNPLAEPPPMTWRQYLERFDPESLDDPEDIWGVDVAGLDEWIDEEQLWDNWFMHDGPGARAHGILQALDLGPRFEDQSSPHCLEFFEDANMVSCWRGVRVADEVTLSLLQQRLNDLDTGIRIVTGFAC